MLSQSNDNEAEMELLSIEELRDFKNKKREGIDIDFEVYEDTRLKDESKKQAEEIAKKFRIASPKDNPYELPDTPPMIHEDKRAKTAETKSRRPL